MDKFIVERELSRSSKGGVLLARRKSDAKLFVLKERRNSELGRGKNVMNEVNLLEKIQHKYIVQLLSHFWDFGVLIMQLEYAKYGDLSQEIESRVPTNQMFERNQLGLAFRQVSKGLEYLHQNRITHRDIKSMNIFIFERTNKRETGIPGLILGNEQVIDGQQEKSGPRKPQEYVLKIGDLGVSRESSVETSCLKSFYGTPLYASPEICENRDYDSRTDIWSLGVLFYEMLTLRHPFQGKSLIALAQDICKVKYDALPSSSDDLLVSIIEGCLQKDPKNRFSLKKIIGITKEIKNDIRTQFEVGCCSSFVKKKHTSPRELHHHSGSLVLSPRTEGEVNSNSKSNSKLKKDANKPKTKLNTRDVESKLARIRASLRRKKMQLKSISNWGLSGTQGEDEKARLKREIHELELKFEALKNCTDSTVEPGSTSSRSARSPKYYSTCPLSTAGASIVNSPRVISSVSKACTMSLDAGEREEQESCNERQPQNNDKNDKEKKRKKNDNSNNNDYKITNKTRTRAAVKNDSNAKDTTKNIVVSAEEQDFLTRMKERSERLAQRLKAQRSKQQQQAEA